MENRSRTPLDNSQADARSQPDRILTVQEVAEMLRVPVSWVYERVRRDGSDRLPHFKLGKYVRFRASAISEWLEHRSEAID
jgi:excisionase family DNA binding protein